MIRNSEAHSKQTPEQAAWQSKYRETRLAAEQQPPGPMRDHYNAEADVIKLTLDALRIPASPA